LNLTDVDDNGAKALAYVLYQNTTLRKIALFYSFIHHPLVYDTTAELIQALIGNFESFLFLILRTCIIGNALCVKLLRMQLSPKNYSIIIVFRIYPCPMYISIVMQL
jgi:hypothetical protein